MQPTGEQRRRRSRHGFTLVEVLLVLALIIALGAIVWPAIDGPFAAERLRAAAEQLQADLARARVAAVDSGTPHRLTLIPGRRDYAAFVAGFGTAQLPGPTADPAAVNVLPIFTRMLPDEITLQAIELAATSAAPPAAATGATEVLFQPDGTTSTVKIVLVNDRQMQVSVRLRGLTGAAAVSDVSAAGNPLVAGAPSP
jgi:type II secretion system protein H